MKYDEVLVHSAVAGWSYITSSIYVVESHFTSDTSSNSSSGELWIFRFITINLICSDFVEYDFVICK